MKKRTGCLIGLLISCIVLPGLIYLGLVIYYQDSFYYGTWINGIYCTGKTVEQVQKELTKEFIYEGLKVVGKDDEAFLEAERLGLSVDFQPALKAYLKKQNPFQWVYQVFTGHQDNFLLPEISIREEGIEEWLKHTEIYQKNQKLPPDSLEIVLTKEGYQLKENKADILQTDKAAEVIKEALHQAEAKVSLMEKNCYIKRQDGPQMTEVRKLYEQVKEFQQLSLTYQIKDQSRAVTSLELAQWLMLDETGENFVLDKEGKLTIDTREVAAFVDRLAEEYDTWHNFPFTTHDGRELLIAKGNYGIQISRKAEVMFLLNLLKEENTGEILRTPEYVKDITYHNQHQIGGTYIEIDMGKQRMFYFEEGELKLETDIVTGCTKKGMGTPEMVCYVYNKKEDAVLRGEDYRSPVNYWVPVYGGIGIHDATWRTKFGGDIYIRDGSHGCINTPLEKMEELYGMIEVGIPVVIHN